MNKPKYVKSIAELVQLSGFPPLEHPVFTTIRVEELRGIPEFFYDPMVFNFYTVGLKKNLKNAVRYGRTNYDFTKGIMGFTAPNQVIEINPAIGKNATGWMLFFQREFILNSPLQRKLDNYGFFEYQTNEALHLSNKEEGIMEGIFENISQEYHNNIDNFSHDVIISYLELLLSYSNRFYSRQFITRKQVDKDLLQRFENELATYFSKELYQELGMPTVTFFAEKLNVSPNYLSEYLKINTSKSTQEHIHLAVIKNAKALLLSTNNTISQIAYDLGFEYPQYFSRLFKQKTGLTPNEFRINPN